MEESKCESSDKNDDGSPNYWEMMFKGTPISVVVPPYIRFLEGMVVQRHAFNFLKSAKEIATAGNPEVLKAILPLENSKESKRLQVTYETYFASHLTSFMVSEMEHFFSGAVSAALKLHPEKMGTHTFKLTEILSSSSNQELIDRAASSVLNKIMYEKPLDYLKSLTNILSIDIEKIAPIWPKYIELKARRDIGVHGNWIVNEIYLRKISEAKLAVSCSEGDRIIPDFIYLEEAMSLCTELAKVFSGALAEKWVKPEVHAE